MYAISCNSLTCTSLLVQMGSTRWFSNSWQIPSLFHWQLCLMSPWDLVYYRWREIPPFFCPMYNSGGSRAPGEYRSVSPTSVVGELMDKLVTRRIQLYLERSTFLSTIQHGSCSEWSCAMDLFLVWGSCTVARSAGSDNVLGVAFIDSIKAFDEVHHSQLLMRTESQGIRSHTLRCVTDFLVNRIFCVQI